MKELVGLPEARLGDCCQKKTTAAVARLAGCSMINGFWRTWQGDIDCETRIGIELNHCHSTMVGLP